MTKVQETSLDGTQIVARLEDHHDASANAPIAPPFENTLILRCPHAFAYTADFVGRVDPCTVVALGLAIEHLWSAR